MTTKEFSDQFDVLYNNITSNQAPGLNEYEKSVFLTKAQAELVKNYFGERHNPPQEGFDSTPKRQSDFSTLIDTSTLSAAAVTTGIDNRTDVKHFKYPKDVFIVLNEIIKDASNNSYSVVPISYEDYTVAMSKPYKYPPKYQAWRLISGFYSDQTIIDVIGKFTGTIIYSIRYVKKPSPIILTDLTADNLSIDNQKTAETCKLPDHLHEEILQRAVELAKIAWEGTAQLAITTGQRSE